MINPSPLAAKRFNSTRLVRRGGIFPSTLFPHSGQESDACGPWASVGFTQILNLFFKMNLNFRYMKVGPSLFESRRESVGKGVPSGSERGDAPTRSPCQQPREGGEDSRVGGKGPGLDSPSSSPSSANSCPGRPGLGPLAAQGSGTEETANSSPDHPAPPRSSAGNCGRGAPLPAGQAGARRAGRGPAGPRGASTCGGAAGGPRRRGGGPTSRRSSRMVAASGR